jgi:DNA repair protein RadC
MYLDSQHRADRVLKIHFVGHGDADQRVPAARSCLRHCGYNAVAVSDPGPQPPLRHRAPQVLADEALTQALKAGLALVDVRVLDHVIVGTRRRP